jgi:pyridine nucleotide-disulfide oxidoreductase
VSNDEILIIGAGPFGLSISAHLRGLGVDHRIVGRPMDTWKAHMPVGMNLRSEPYGSDMSSPKAGYDVAAYCRLRGLDYVDRLGPLSGERFLDYADWYTEQLVPDVSDVTVTEITAVDGGFKVAFADADSLTARQIVVATGVLPYATIPDELSGLPSELISHTADHHDLERFQGRRVAVVGGGQSALETAALLHEAGADTQVVVRRPAVSWLEPNPERLSRLGHIRRPVNRLCEGWHCAFWNSPAAFRRLPQDMRITKARTVLGPAGAWWLKDRVDGVVDMLTEHHVRGAAPSGNGVRLLVDGPKQSAVDADHVIAGTGFRVDLARLPFLPEGLRAGIATLNGYPVVSRAGESTVPGLYFAGAPAAVSLGPSVRFIAGTHNSARQVAQSLAHRSKVSRNHSASPDKSQLSTDAAFQETA